MVSERPRLRELPNADNGKKSFYNGYRI
jgi:hypothetical protein